MSKKLVRVRGEENCPSYRSKEMQPDLIGRLTKKAVNKAVFEEDAPVDELRIETRYVHGRTEPHTSFGEVTVSRTSVRSDPEELLQEMLVAPAAANE